VEFPLARAVLDAGLAARAFPAVAVEVGRASGVLWREALGRLRTDADAPLCTPDTIFDLASLTKVLATTAFVMRAVSIGALELDVPAADYLPSWRDGAHDAITIRHLLDHSSGLPAHARLWEQARGRSAYAAAIHALPLDHAAGQAAVYSDLGFITLGFVLADVVGPLDRQMQALADDLEDGTVRFLPPDAWLERTAPTEFDPWRNRLLQGEVHDENAAALDGVAGHAGLFGTVAAVGAYARLVLRTCTTRTALGDPGLMREIGAPSRVPGSSRAIGWDTMRPTSSCGTRCSASAIGHTGFTGTSLWIDRERDVYVALLTNRVYPTRNNDAIRAIRPRFHDAVAEDLERAEST
jgi:CubicO group peptidase (beta-lactamase class C family)